MGRAAESVEAGVVALARELPNVTAIAIPSREDHRGRGAQKSEGDRAEARPW